MANPGSYTITLDNNKAEQEAIAYLLASDPNFFVPNIATRKMLLEKMGLDTRFARAFDLIETVSPISDGHALESIDLRTLSFVELKTTRKKLVRCPEGFFFGATENEFNLARTLGKQYKFCFVSLHPDSKSFVLLSLEELEKRIKTKRVQYQINL